MDIYDKLVSESLREAAFKSLDATRNATEQLINAEDTVARLTEQMKTAQLDLERRKGIAEAQYKATVQLFRISGEDFIRFERATIEFVELAFNFPTTRGFETKGVDLKAVRRLIQSFMQEGKNAND